MVCGDARMVWMLMPGQTWAGAAASFAAVWTVMMVPMMLPSLAPGLRHHRVPSAAATAAGYFFVWAMLGWAVYPLGVLLAETGTRPVAGLVVIAAGVLQFSAWKRKHLDCYRKLTDRRAGASAAWLHGMHLSMRCALCCGNLMAVLLVAGVMDWTVMLAVTAAITAERLAPAGARVAQGIGVAVIGYGLWLLAFV